MRAGDVVGGYRLLRDFTTAGGGLSMWTLAERGGTTYFIKQFLAPKWPVAGGPGTERTKAARRRACERFEKHHGRMMELLRSRSVPGGNLVVAIDFVRIDGIYYKITEAVDVAAISVAQIAALPIEDRLLILKTVTHSVGILHAAGLVHGDIKPDNILIKRTASGNYTTKLIDFDNSFVAGEPPPAEETVGDAVFLSPELAAHIAEAGPSSAVTTSSDIFALGVLFSFYLTGRVPVVAGAGGGVQVHERVAAGGVPVTHWPGVPRDLGLVVDCMLRRAPTARPSAAEVLDALKRRSGADLAARPDPGRLRGRLIDASATAPKPGGLRGSLIRAGSER